ncbi:3-dehydroquinate synthase [uncultured Flavonifractor sp.]|uniref:3-dehydroquinate synthase n=1 Tax=Flintibacter hominis TaxID=2763048 RepID=A0A8J6IXS0_9FIRM|nr:MULTISPECIES: 3-dehydroquinate synthase [Eubacteriales]MBC5722440.1 3-dehydroquinate synthase [Flintibacter hominis]MBS5589555.1 3-dehydroquinate synthase [Clostridiales bacterium]MCH1979727.1 3-dehydroquinate synthase [Lawsonibacter sp. OA9]SCI43351.1 3-dehydroquinate synthase [uncultured Flavonifractor sp.]
MKTLAVNTSRPYEIKIGRGSLDQAGVLCRQAIPNARKLTIVTDSRVLPLYLARTADSLEQMGFQIQCLTVPAGEASKSAEQLVILWEKMMAFGMTRTDAVVALGGGVVGDLAGFAAATLLRGVDYVQIPTTLLSQVDSSVGGKVAIDLRAGKNLAGAFWQPSLVIIDPGCLDTLPDRTFSDGMAEVIKYGCILDRKLFELLNRCGSRVRVMERIVDVVYTCCDLKRRVVVEDERDTGLRQLLNFGHTVGHAFELAGHYETWTHGQGVAAGMNWAAQLGVELGVTPPETVECIQELLKKFDLPLDIPCPWETMTEAVGLDKKNAGDHISLIVLEKLGQAVHRKMARDELLGLLKCMYGR